MGTNNSIKLSDNPKSVEDYFICDNGWQPFIVNITPSKISIYKNNDYVYDDNMYNDTDQSRDNLIIVYNEYIKVYIGYSPLTSMTRHSGSHGSKFDGNSILIHISDNKYVYVGSEIYEFEIDDDIVIDYVSPVGNNDVPYPYIVGMKNTYLMLEQVIIPNKDIILENPYYMYYYNMSPFIKKNIKGLVNIKLIHERL